MCVGCILYPGTPEPLGGRTALGALGTSTRASIRFPGPRRTLTAPSGGVVVHIMPLVMRTDGATSSCGQKTKKSEFGAC